MVPSFCKLKLSWPVKLGMAFVKSLSFYDIHVLHKVIIFTMLYTEDLSKYHYVGLWQISSHM